MPFSFFYVIYIIRYERAVTSCDETTQFRIIYFVCCWLDLSCDDFGQAERRQLQLIFSNHLGPEGMEWLICIPLVCVCLNVYVCRYVCMCADMCMCVIV